MDPMDPWVSQGHTEKKISSRSHNNSKKRQRLVGQI